MFLFLDIYNLVSNEIIFENQSELKIFEQNIENDFISGCHSWDKICEQLVKYYENIRNSI
ncbi:hypothetical protein FACS189426_06990 [Bacteroidia bacterium]|nr:hypothetical protein FACS189426_06990 [Bacteroidia bacterium]